MECVLKIIQGAESNEEFRCTDAESVIGRSPRAVVRIQHPSLSFEHAMVTRVADAFFLENLSASGTYVNDQRITSRVRLHAKDRIKVGQGIVIRVESVPAVASDEGRRRLLLYVVAIVIVASAAIILIDPFNQGSSNVNWNPVYAKLDGWVQEQVNEHLLPTDVRTRLENAWRLRIAGDNAAAASEWLRLQVTLSEQTTMYGATQSVGRRRQVLSALIQPKDPPVTLADEDMGAALIQFVADMARRG